MSYLTFKESSYLRLYSTTAICASAKVSFGKGNCAHTNGSVHFLLPLGTHGNVEIAFWVAVRFVLNS